MFRYLEPCIGVDHKRDRQTDGRTDRQTEPPLAIARSNSVRRAIIRTSIQ